MIVVYEDWQVIGYGSVGCGGQCFGSGDGFGQVMYGGIGVGLVVIGGGYDIVVIFDCVVQIGQCLGQFCYVIGGGFYQIVGVVLVFIDWCVDQDVMGYYVFFVGC